LFVKNLALDLASDDAGRESRAGSGRAWARSIACNRRAPSQLRAARGPAAGQLRASCGPAAPAAPAADQLHQVVS